MKNLTLTILLIFAGFSYAQDRPAQLNNKAGRSFFVGIVVHSSPASSKDWNIRKSRAIELVSNLDQSDKVIILEARPGRPSVCGKTFIGGPQKAGSNEVVSNVSVMNKEWLASADVARACESVYDIFISEGSNYNCLLVVLTSGKLRDKQIQKILRTSSQIKMLDGFVGITYDPAVANQNMINAGKKNDVDILLESNPDFSQWLESKRDNVEPYVPVIEKTEYVVVKPNLISITDTINKALTSLKSDEKNVTTPTPVPAPKADYPPIIKESAIEEPNTIANDTDVHVVMPDEHVPAKGKSMSLIRWITIILAVILTLAILTKFLSKQLRKTNSSYDDPESDEKPSNLKVIVGDQDIDLGEIDLISELSMGNDPGCGIFVEDEQVSPLLARISKTKKGFKLQNFDTEPLIVNGLDVKHKKKVNLDLPADIQLANGLMINVYTETTPEIKEEDDE